jgi:ribosomal protein S18 acetylase RimI-like enzyme
MEVRRIRPDEVEAYRDVRLRALRLAPYAFSTTFEEASVRGEAEWREFTERLATSAHTAGFALDRGAGTFGGLVSVRIKDREDSEDHEAEVNQMWLDEDLRGGDWGRALLDACERFAADAGVERLTLWVAEGNERAARLYARRGYLPTGETKAFPTGGLELRLAKALP